MDPRHQMARRKFRLPTVLIAAAALVLIARPAAADPPLPQPLPVTGDCYHDNIFYGAVPAGSEQRPVLVFAHGHAGLASDWWLNVLGLQANDMYAQAYQAGYRTAFVNLNVDPAAPGCLVNRQPGQDMMYNGYVFSRQLELITQYYGVSQVDIVAHSKGGIDAQAAIVWWGAWSRVRNVFTLGSPHQGSLMADLLWSPEGFWVSLILGQRDEATFSMRTDVMQLFRGVTDPSLVDDAVQYYSGAGNFWQTPNSIYMLSGAWLNSQPGGGENDGVVTVASTHLPGARSLFLSPWDHVGVAVGWNAFPYIHRILLDIERPLEIYLPMIGSRAPPGSSLAAGGTRPPPDLREPSGGREQPLTPPSCCEPGRQDAHGGARTTDLQSNFILRGGRLNGSVSELVPIEPQARTATFMLLATDEEVTAALVGPDGLTRPLQAVTNDHQGLFASASVLAVALNQPHPGQWSVQLSGPPGEGYLLVVTLDSALRVRLDGLPEQPIAPGMAVQLRAQVHTPPGSGTVNRVTLRTDRTAPGISASYLQGTATRAGSSLSPVFDRAGLYSTSITVSGETAEGQPFERSFVRSLAVAP